MEETKDGKKEKREKTVMEKIVLELNEKDKEREEGRKDGRKRNKRGQ